MKNQVVFFIEIRLGCHCSTILIKTQIFSKEDSSRRILSKEADPIKVPAAVAASLSNSRSNSGRDRSGLNGVKAKRLRPISGSQAFGYDIIHRSADESPPAGLKTERPLRLFRWPSKQFHWPPNRGNNCCHHLDRRWCSAARRCCSPRSISHFAHKRGLPH